MTSTDSILQLISEIHIPRFFITVDFLQIGEAIPQGISGFLKKSTIKYLMVPAEENLFIKNQVGAWHLHSILPTG